jgi:hypothetical protein
LVFADAASLHNPELSFNLPLREASDKGPYCIEKVIWRWLRGETQYRNTSVMRGSEEQWIPEIEIKSDEAPLLGRAGGYQLRICHTAETLLPDSSHVVPSLAEKLSTAPPKVLVQLESHACVSRGISK